MVKDHHEKSLCWKNNKTNKSRNLDKDFARRKSQKISLIISTEKYTLKARRLWYFKKREQEELLEIKRIDDNRGGA